MEAKLLPDSFNPLFFDAKVSHFVQSWAWGEIRKKTGVKVLRIGFFEQTTLTNVAQVSLHKIPNVNKYLGLLSKCPLYSKEELTELVKIGQAHNMIAIRLEPDVVYEDDPGQVIDSRMGTSITDFLAFPKLSKAPRNYYIPHNFLLDLTKTEDELLAAMHPKTRYNIRIAQKHGVLVEEKNDEQTQKAFITLQKQTAQRQGFYVHPDTYYQAVFATLLPNSATFLVAKAPDGTMLTIWFLVFFKKTATYLYGASSDENKHLMANNLVAWQALCLAKAHGLAIFDFGGTLGNDAKPSDNRFGFHKFKEGFSGKHVDYLGTYDLVISPLWYQLFSFADQVRWIILRIVKR